MHQASAFSKSVGVVRVDKSLVSSKRSTSAVGASAFNPLDYNYQMLTIAELPEYIRHAEKLLSVADA